MGADFFCISGNFQKPRCPGGNVDLAPRVHLQVLAWPGLRSSTLQHTLGSTSLYVLLRHLVHSGHLKVGPHGLPSLYERKNPLHPT